VGGFSNQPAHLRKMEVVLVLFIAVAFLAVCFFLAAVVLADLCTKLVLDVPRV
jgi:hypothetical protein